LGDGDATSAIVIMIAAAAAAAIVTIIVEATQQQHQQLSIDFYIVTVAIIGMIAGNRMERYLPTNKIRRCSCFCCC